MLAELHGGGGGGSGGGGVVVTAVVVAERTVLGVSSGVTVFISLSLP